MDTTVLERFGVKLSGKEKLITIVRPHPIGIVGIYLGTMIAVAALLSVVILVLPTLVGGNGGEAGLGGYLWGIVSLFIVLGLLVLAIATHIYKQNRLILTDTSLTQVAQAGLFNRKISRISLASIEDVSSQQNGILPQLFGYGTVSVETAGEQNNFHFRYCPKPNEVATMIQEAREQFATRGSQE